MHFFVELCEFCENCGFSATVVTLARHGDLALQYFVLYKCYYLTLENLANWRELLG